MVWVPKARACKFYYPKLWVFPEMMASWWRGNNPGILSWAGWVPVFQSHCGWLGGIDRTLSEEGKKEEFLGPCCGWNVPPNFHMLEPNPKIHMSVSLGDGALGMWLGHEGSAHINGLIYSGISGLVGYWGMEGVTLTRAQQKQCHALDLWPPELWAISWISVLYKLSSLWYSVSATLAAKAGLEGLLWCPVLGRRRGMPRPWLLCTQ